MSADTPSLGEVILAAIESAVGDIRTTLPGVILAYDPDTERGTVQALIPDGVFDEGDARTPVAIPTMSDVPVLGIGAGTLRIKVPIKKGCPCLLLFSSSCIARLKATGRIEVADPGDDRRHHEADVFAMPVTGYSAAKHDDPDAMIEFTDTGLIRAGGDEPLVTRAEFLAHGHPTAGTGPASAPVVVTPAASAVTFPGTPKLRG